MNLWLLLTLILLALFIFSAGMEVYAQKRGMFPFVLFVGAYYFVFHGLLSWYAASNVPHLPFPGEASMDALLFTALFVVILLAGYASSLLFWRFRAPAPVQEDVGPLAVFAVGLLALHFLFYAVPAIASLPSIPQLLHPSWYCGFAILSYLALQGRLRGPFVGALAAITVLKLILDTRTGQITPLVFTFAILLSVFLMHRRYWLCLGSLAACATIILSYGYAKYVSRAVVADDPVNIFRFEPELSLGSLAASVDAMARRSGHALLTNHVMAKTPGEVPYTDRDPLVDSVRNHVPRLVWPTKPREERGNEFGKRYGILDPDDSVTSWNIPWVADFFTAYGRPLALLYSFAVGAVLGIGVQWMSSRPRRTLWFGIFTAALFPLFYQESNFSLMAGSVLWVIAVLYVSHRIAMVAWAAVQGARYKTSA